MTIQRTLTALGILGALSGCHIDPGVGDYASQESFDFPDVSGGDVEEAEALPGPDPYEEGELRLSFGTFYESGASTFYVVDDATIFLYLYGDEFSSSQSVALTPVPEPLEGVEATEISYGPIGWFGFGIHLGEGQTRDMSDWSTLHVSLRSSDPGFAEIELGMNDLEGTGSVRASDYGYTNDGAWHSLEIPVADLVSAGVNIAETAAFLVVTGTGGAEGETALIDAVYFTAE